MVDAFGQRDHETHGERLTRLEKQMKILLDERHEKILKEKLAAKAALATEQTETKVEKPAKKDKKLVEESAEVTDVITDNEVEDENQEFVNRLKKKQDSRQEDSND